jgi:(E)-4-hydroxy-3-methylbut-2-enyl-diphosphate synthase
MRHKTRTIYVGGVPIGGENPVRVQSMCNTDTKDVGKTLSQVSALIAAGCELVRVAVPDKEAATALKEIVEGAEVPIIADIHFDHRLAILSLEAGAACVRVNPGNIKGRERFREVILCAKELNRAVRIGVNSGSLEQDLLDKYGVSVASIVTSAERAMEVPEDEGFSNYKVSLKSSNVPLTLNSYIEFAEKTDVPLHIGITEAGGERTGTIRSAVGIGALLLNGLGDTVRVSLTAEPVREVAAAWDILAAAGVRRRGAEIISCPTCGRTEVDLISIAEKVESECGKLKFQGLSGTTVAVMGCAVNGPGEAREADFGIACGKGCGLIFSKGNIVKKVDENMLVEELMKTIREHMNRENINV